MARRPPPAPDTVEPLADAPEDLAPLAQASPPDPEALQRRRNLTRDLARASNRRLVPRDKREEVAEEAFARWRTVDPFPEIPPALLNAADLADYVRTAGMVWPFRPDGLKPASIELHVQGEYLYFDENGKRRQGYLLPREHPDFTRLKARSSLTVRGNSIVFVSVEETLRLPDYIAMRFNLKIDHVYKGLLLGTGPLVDPGFVGLLHIPLHNLTQEDYEFKAGAGLIWAEFTKLSPNALFASGSKIPAGRQGRYPPLQRKAGPLRPIEEYILEGAGGVKPRSSIPDAIKRANRAQRQVRRLRMGAAIGAFVALVGLFFPIYSLTYGARNDRIAELQNQVDRQRSLLQRQQEDIDRLVGRPVSPSPSASAKPGP